MRQTELRLGNYVEIGINEKLESVFSTIEELSNNTNVVLTKDKNILRVFPIDVIKPIEITEEWLVKLGFEKALYEKNFPLYYDRNNTGHFDAISVSVYDNFSRVKIVDKTVRTVKYVHELQNLYFAITQTELYAN